MRCFCQALLCVVIVNHRVPTGTTNKRKQNPTFSLRLASQDDLVLLQASTTPWPGVTTQGGAKALTPAQAKTLTCKSILNVTPSKECQVWNSQQQTLHRFGTAYENRLGNLTKKNSATQAGTPAPTHQGAGGAAQNRDGPPANMMVFQVYWLSSAV